MKLTDDELARIAALEGTTYTAEMARELLALREVVEAARALANDPEAWGHGFHVPPFARLRDAFEEYNTTTP